MTFYEAARMAKDAQVKELWLTHFSPSLVHPQEYTEAVRRIFPNTIVPKDRRTTTLLFEEDEE
jgi:ribonuclease Z